MSTSFGVGLAVTNEPKMTNLATCPVYGPDCKSVPADSIRLDVARCLYRNVEVLQK